MAGVEPRNYVRLGTGRVATRDGDRPGWSSHTIPRDGP